MDLVDMDISTKPPTGRRMKPRAPPPPGAPQPAPRKIFTTPRNAVPDGGGRGGDTKENMLLLTVDLHITLPDGLQTNAIVDGSKALMDLLVDLCGRYHLNPAYHTLELLSPEARPVGFKPNALLGTLDVQYVLIKEKVPEDKVVRKPPPKVPEKTVRLVVNYHRTQKAVVRVNPQVPLGSLVPVICEKCEFDPRHVILLKDSVSNHEMDLDKSLTELGIRELYVLDQKLVLQPKMASAPALNYSESLRSNTLSSYTSETKGLLGFFKFNRRKSKTVSTAPVIPCEEARPHTLGQSQSVMNISRMSPKVEVKKRRAPPPPQATPTPSMAQRSAETCQVRSSSPSGSQLKKRRAPAPPPTPVSSTPAGDSVSGLSRGPSTENSEPPGSLGSRSSSSSSLVNRDSAVSSRAGEGGAAPGDAPGDAPNDAPDDTESALDLDVENNRHSTIGADQRVPQKPRRTPTREPPTLTIPPPPPDTPPPKQQDSHDARLEQHFEAEPQPWLHSLPDGTAAQALQQEPDAVSMTSSSSSSSLPDQGYAPSEGMAEDSAFVSSPSDIAQPASPDGSLLLDRHVGRAQAPPKDSSSDSDEGCATWGSRHRHSDDSCLVQQSDQRMGNYEKELYTDLADVDCAHRASICESSASDRSYHSEIPVSFLDLEVPVTTINEVLDDLELSTADCEVLPGVQSVGMEKEIPVYRSHLGINSDSALSSHAVSSSDNRAELSASLSEERPSGSTTNEDNEEETIAIPVTEIQDGPWKEDNILEAPVAERRSLQSASSIKVIPSSPTRNTQCLGPGQDVTDRRPVETEEAFPFKWHTSQSTITQSANPRFGLKTFTIVPPKPAVTKKQAGSLIMGAIKIDKLGNMVPEDSKYSASPGSGSDTDLPLVEKAKAFWSSANQQDTDSGSRGVATKMKEVQTAKPAPPDKDSVETKGTFPGTESKRTFSELAPQPTKPVNEPEQRRDLSFLKPSRRTSSQYVASAIAKYSGVPTNSQRVQDSNAVAELSASKQRFSGTKSFSNGHKYAGLHSNNTTSTQDYEDTLEVKRNSSSILETISKHSMNVQDCGNLDRRVDSSVKSSSHEKACMIALNANSGNSESATAVCAHKSFASMQQPSSTSSLQPGVSKIHNSTKDTLLQKAKDEHCPTLDKETDPQPSSTAPSENGQQGLFGPVRKFKPVLLKSVQKETSLHSSLMEAIQSGDGKERLRKVSSSVKESTRTSSSPAAVENERSALLAAIRAQNNTTRLRKTKSEAASEVEECRKAETTHGAHTAEPTPTPLSVPPPPPHPAPPPPVFYVPNTMSAVRDLEGAREALLEAIRSGSGAQRLKKVPVPKKTLLVNGRLGMKHASSSIVKDH